MTVSELKSAIQQNKKTNPSKAMSLNILLQVANNVARQENRNIIDEDIIIAVSRLVKKLEELIEYRDSMTERYINDIELYKSIIKE